MKNELQPTRGTFSRNCQCKKAPCWPSKFFSSFLCYGAQLVLEIYCKDIITSWGSARKCSFFVTLFCHSRGGPNGPSGQSLIKCSFFVTHGSPNWPFWCLFFIRFLFDSYPFSPCLDLAAENFTLLVTYSKTILVATDSCEVVDTC